MITLTLSGMVIQRWSGHIAQTFGFIADSGVQIR